MNLLCGASLLLQIQSGKEALEDKAEMKGTFLIALPIILLNLHCIKADIQWDLPPINGNTHNLNLFDLFRFPMKQVSFWMKNS